MASLISAILRFLVSQSKRPPQKDDAVDQLLALVFQLIFHDSFSILKNRFDSLQHRHMSGALGSGVKFLWRKYIGCQKKIDRKSLSCGLAEELGGC
jgi:hypothetical protein